MRQLLQSIFRLDLRSLAILRIAFGVLLIADILDRTRDLQAHLTEQGVLPVAALWGLNSFNPRPVSWLCFHSWSGTLWYQVLLVVLGIALGAALAVGFRTRVTTVLCWLYVLSLQMRNPLLFHGGDTIMRMMLFWGMFLPWGRLWSWDARNKEFDGPLNVFSFGTVGYLLQLSYQYFSSGMFKVSPEWWSEGTAVYYSVTAAQYEAPGGQVLSSVIAGIPEVGQTLTYVTLAWERLFPLLLLSPVRPVLCRSVAVVSIWLFHGGLLLTLSLGLFPIIGLACGFGAIPSAWWEKTKWRIPKGDLDGVERRLGRWQIIPLLAAIWTIFYGLADLPQHSYRVPSTLRFIGGAAGLNQSWMLFAPAPPKTHGFYIAAGYTKDGQRYQMLGGARPLSWVRPSLVPASAGGMRWRMYCYRLFTRRNFRTHRELLCRYLARDWKRSGRPALDKIELYYVWGPMRPYEQTDFKPSRLWTYRLD